MTARHRLLKRSAEYVPQVYRTELNKLSKAALMELLWDFAFLTTGASNDAEAFALIRDYHRALKLAGYHGSGKL